MPINYDRYHLFLVVMRDLTVEYRQNNEIP